MQKKLTVTISIIISFVAVSYLAFFVLNFRDVSNVILNTNYQFFLLAMVIYSFGNLAGAYRFKYVLHKLGKKTRFSSCYWANQVGMLFSNFTFGRMGYVFGASRYLSQSENINAGFALGLIGDIAIFELILKVVGSIVGATFLIQVLGFTEIIGTISLGVLTSICIIMVFLLTFWINPQHIGRITRYFPHSFQQLYYQMFETVSKMKPLSIQILAISFLNWILRGVEWWSLSLAIGIPLGVLPLFLLHPILTISRFTPFTVAGIGAFEGIMIVAMGLFGVPPESTLFFAILDRLNNILIDSIGFFRIRRIL